MNSLACFSLLLMFAPFALAEVRAVSSPPTDRSTSLYPTNREPLAKSPFVKLPIGAITPKGWLRGQLDLMKTGMTGQLEQISPWCKFQTSAWHDPQHGKNGWEEMPPKISHCFGGDTPLALNDGILPKSSHDQDIPRMTFWDHKGTTECVEYDFDKPRQVKQSDVYWFDDEQAARPGQCRTPASYRVLYLTGGDWKEIPNSKGLDVEKDRFNTTTFDAVETKGIRLEVQLREGVSAGILEWRVE